jgi:hypothetical protein
MGDGDGGGGRKAGKDAPGTSVEFSPAGMELTIPSNPAIFKETPIPETVDDHSSRLEKGEDALGEEKPQEKPMAQLAEDKNPNIERQSTWKTGTAGAATPTRFREQFDHLMKRLEDRFQTERLGLEEKHSRELEEAMGYFSLNSDEREAKQQELQIALLEDIGSMAQQLQDLTGALGPQDDMENLTLPSDPKVLDEYARKMQSLEEQFQKEKLELERKHAAEMEEALGTLKLSREQREAKQLELQDHLSAEIGDMAKQLEELNHAKKDYETKMEVLKKHLTDR